MTTTETEDWSLVDQVNADTSPARSLHRRAVLQAIYRAAVEHDGLVHASWVRPLLPPWVDEHMRGGITSGLVASGILVSHGQPRRSLDSKNRNGNRWLSTYRVADMPALAAHVHGEVA